MKKIKIAIDGPAASGKSTTAKLVAKRLGYVHVDTGAMYRAVTLKVLEQNVNVEDEENVTRLARTSSIMLGTDSADTRIYLDGTDVSDIIRTPVVSRAVSAVSSYKGVREVMVREQRKMAENGGIVLEGRDIGTVVLPSAELKIFMVASSEERAKRRKKDLALNGIDASEKELKDEIEARDEKDSTRQLSPLKKAGDALELDTTTLTVEEQVEFILERARKLIQE